MFTILVETSMKQKYSLFVFARSTLVIDRGLNIPIGINKIKLGCATNAKHKFQESRLT